jgi:ABC-type oligopeptide transport system substrate-binding subunit
MNDAKIRRRRFLAAGPLMLWTDPKFDTNVAEANAVAEKDVRMRRLSECEEYLLRAIPLIPLFRAVSRRLEKPYGRGLDSNIVHTYPFKYAPIDTKWRLQ